MPATTDSRTTSAGAPTKPSITLPRIALGCGNFGGIGSAIEFFGQGLNDAQAGELMDAAWEMGITHFDTADSYGGGRSEAAIGRWMSSRAVRPTLTSKTFNPLTEGGDRGLNPDRVARSLEASLERLGVDRLELYLAHEVDPDVPLDVAVSGFEAQRAAGKIDAYGLSNVKRDQLELALRAGRPTAVQNGYSLLQRVDADELLGFCADRGVAYTAYSPLSGGWLTGKYARDKPYPAGSRMTLRPEPYAELASERTFAALDVLGHFAAEHEISMAGAAIAWLLFDPRVTQIVIGPGRPEQLRPLSEALDHPIGEHDYDMLNGAFA